MNNFTQEEKDILQKEATLPNIFVNCNKEVWTKAFSYFNSSFPERRPLSMKCRLCYNKVAYYVLTGLEWKGL